MGSEIALIIIGIVLAILLIRVIVLIAIHLTVVFYDKATKHAVEHIMKDPYDFVRSEHICKFFYNMIWVVVFVKLLIALFTGHVEINT